MCGDDGTLALSLYQGAACKNTAYKTGFYFWFLGSGQKTQNKMEIEQLQQKSFSYKVLRNTIFENITPRTFKTFKL